MGREPTGSLTSPPSSPTANELGVVVSRSTAACEQSHLAYQIKDIAMIASYSANLIFMKEGSSKVEKEEVSFRATTNGLVPENKIKLVLETSLSKKYPNCNILDMEQITVKREVQLKMASGEH